MLLTIDEAALLMRVSTRTVRREVALGRLTARRVGRQLRLPLDQFSDFVDTAAVAKEIRARADRAGVND
jgi:excisionase family DNA binding protein